MTPYHEADGIRLFLGDCREVMRSLPAESVDAIVTDPPYGIGFMGKEWDTFNPKYVKAACEGRRHKTPILGRGTKPEQAAWVAGRYDRSLEGNHRFQEWFYSWALEALRVLKPGGHMVVFGGTRTHHRLWCAVEDAGFEIRDCLMWIYGTGFPKSLDVSKAIDKRGGQLTEERQFAEYIRSKRQGRQLSRKELNTEFGYVAGCNWWESTNPPNFRYPSNEDYAKLKALLLLDERYDYLLGAERPVLRSSVRGPAGFSNEQVPRPWKKHIGEKYDLTAPATDAACQWQGWGTALKPAWEPILLARKPLSGTVAANVQRWGTGAINVDGCRIEGAYKWRASDSHEFDGSSFCDGSFGDGPHPSGRWPANLVLDEEAAAMLDATTGELSSGFMRADTERSTDGGYHGDFPKDRVGEHDTYGDKGGPSRFFYTSKAGADERAGGKHPTVKPRDLMLWLCRLITPPGGLILDPFIGSGTTAVAAIMGGFRCVGIDNNEEYLSHAAERLRLGDEGLAQVVEARRAGAEQAVML